MGVEGLKKLEKCSTLYTNNSVASQYGGRDAGGLAKVKRDEWAWTFSAGFCNFYSMSVGAWKQEPESGIIFLELGLSPPLGSRESESSGQAG